MNLICAYSGGSFLGHKQVLEDCMPGLTHEDLELKREELRTPDVRAFLVTHRSRLVAVLVYYFEEDYLGSGTRTLFVQEVGVQTMWQKKGIGDFMEHEALQVEEHLYLSLDP